MPRSLFAEIGWAGMNRLVISTKKGQAMQLSQKRAGSPGDLSREADGPPEDKLTRRLRIS